jgi:hypothetical protein
VEGKPDDEGEKPDDEGENILKPVLGCQHICIVAVKNPMIPEYG